jgi:choline kinase
VFLLPFYRFAKDAMRIWLAEIEKFVDRGIVGVYAEEAFNKISHQIGLAPVCIGENEFCMEVDNPQDLELARELAANKKI